MFTEIEISAMRGAAAVDAAGAKIGTVGDVYLDDASGQPAWATVESGLFGTRVRFVPLGGARVEGRRLVLGFGKDAVLAAPRVAEDEHLSAEEESVLYAHYGVSAPTPPAPAQDAVAAEATPPDALPADTIPVVPAPAGPAPDDDEALQEAVEATEVAQQAAQKADPLGDGSYAGDASKAPLIDTADLEAHDHGRAATSATSATSATAAVPPAAAPSLNRPPFRADGATSEEADDAASDLPEGVDPADVAAYDRAAEAASRAGEARWAAAHGRPASDPEDDL